MCAAVASTVHAAPDGDGESRLPLDAIFAPRTVAVIGATDKQGSVGRAVLWNLISNPFGATVYPINAHRPNVLGIKAYPSVAEAPGAVDLAVVATPAPTVPGVIAECVDAGVGGAVIISAGFKEIGAEGARLEREVLEQAARGRMRIIGPNCVGVMRPYSGMNATFAARLARPGSVGFISQSGALCTAILDWSFRENVGFSAFISVGSMLDVGWGDLIDYLGDDPYTKCIVIYMESIGDARSFLSASREVALAKPIVVIKAGRTEAAAKAAASHTGSLTGSDEVLDAAFRRVGVLRVDSISQVFDMAEVLSKQPRPRGPRLAILTNAGGPGVLATDTLIEDGGELAALSPETLAALDGFLPPAWSRGNPIDILGDADPGRYDRALAVTAKDPGIDGLLAILTPQAMTDPTATAELLRQHAKISGKPILASWMGGDAVEAGEQILNRAGIPTYRYPDTAAAAFTMMWRSSYNLQGLYETPNLPADGETAALARDRAEAVVAAARREGRSLLTEAESKRLLAAYGIPTARAIVADSPAAAVAAAGEIGYPVVLKLHSRTITHKTDVGGVQLNLRDADAVRDAYRAIEAAVRRAAAAAPGAFEGVTVQPMIKVEGYELILGSSLDPQFGPVLLFGTGGQLVEVFKDRALGLPPLNTTLARRMIEQTRIHRALRGVRGRRAVDLAALEQLLVRFSRLVIEQPSVREIDINPLLASPEQLIALDARVILHAPGVDLGSLPRPAIRPYPTQYASAWTAEDGTAFTLRPIRPEDEPLLVKFHGTLSERSVSLRYFHAMKYTARVAHERLTRICFIDYDREMALVADRKDPSTGEHEILGVGRLSKVRGTDEAEFALVVSDPYQGLGLGTEFLSRLVRVGREEGIRRIFGDILPENIEMQRICEKLGFKMTHNIQESVIRATLVL
ncbi:Succinyl-CoA ligase [ADP-forming] subunit alpha [Aquisphaera giovannonii]|uniref:Succinyl-CoA ligase [ADP-forming] subunit alpha n=1 Tax=Aquisphaera giovannonii TaxID=406548 RepID=A0A5B9VUW6_9BACT|nr:bifunctional acetate--CoA ligase family protein/GNAT family N-acetyltransferase [Aquisphaera giovannonii]QEH31874.1 Succinyl-CoA ligase [ADP-forming] subunit alpha [Aquisphaera giovannonii]